MIIKTKEFILRRPKKRDFKSFYKNFNDKLIYNNMFSPKKFPVSLKDAKKEFFNLIKNKNSFVIEVNKEIAGEITLSNLMPKLRAKISYWIGKDYRNKGIMTRAVKISTNYFFKKYQLRRIYGNVRVFNKASCRVLEKAGYELEGIQKKHFMKNGKYFDDFLYAKIK